ncbi:threonine deaminase [Tilletia horrida]|nr:threonine deaminase [Tilletia horrida]
MASSQPIAVSAPPPSSAATAAAAAGAAERAQFPRGTGLVDNDVQPSRPPTPVQQDGSAAAATGAGGSAAEDTADASSPHTPRVASTAARLAMMQVEAIERAKQRASAGSSADKATAAAPSLPTHLYSLLPPHLMLPDGTPDYLRLILTAQLEPLVRLTPLERANNLSARLGCEVLLKREDLQPVFSFKLRGAFNMMRQLTHEQKWKGVIACSAGNHAQGVAMAGAHLKIPCTIVMPTGTPEIKSANVARLGAKVVLHGQDFDAAKAECNRLAQAYGLTIIPPFDHPHVIAGQGTIASEISRQLDLTSVDAIFCCVGGGGLLAGVSAFVKRIAPPHVKVIGVETYDGDALYRSLQAGKRVLLDDVGLFSDGTAVRIVGEECFRICSETVDDVVRVSNDEICAAIKDIFEETRSVPEPAGALATAGMKRYIDTYNLRGSGKKFVTLVSGANLNFSRLRFVAERADIGERREAMVAVAMDERRGQFLDLYQNHIHPRTVTEVSYRYGGIGKGKAHIFISFLLSVPPGSDAGPAGVVVDDADEVKPPTLGLAAAASAALTDSPGKADLQASLQWAAAIGKGGANSNGDARLNWGVGGPKPAEGVAAGTAGLGLGPAAAGAAEDGLSSSPSSSTGTATTTGLHAGGAATVKAPTPPVPADDARSSAGESSGTAVGAAALGASGSNVSSRPRAPGRRASGATTDDLRPPSPELQQLLLKLEAAGMPSIDISGNELAKAHARYIIGGRINVKYERIFRFEFPERPNALQKFLVTLHETNTKYPRNITLFHYRNYGSDVGKVLAGIAVDLDSDSDAAVSGLSEEERELEARRDLDRWLVEELGYPFVEETENVVYRRFLREG